MSEHECIVCGSMHDPERAEQAERALDEMRQSLEPGTPERIFVGLMEKCQARGIGSPYSAIHVVSQVMEYIDTLRATLARVEALKNDAILRFDEIDRECEALTAERDGLARERDALKAMVQEGTNAMKERDGLRAFIEANFHKTTLEIINEREDLKEIIGDLLKRSDGLRSALERAIRVIRDAASLMMDVDDANATSEIADELTAALGRTVNNDPTRGV